MISWQIKAIQNRGSAIGLPARNLLVKITGIIRFNMPESPSEKSHFAASGNTDPGPTELGAVARAIITHIDPITCANANVAQT